jgi:hypothetical protein
MLDARASLWNDRGGARESRNMKGAKKAPKATTVEIVVPAMPENTPTTFGGPNSGNIGFKDLPPPRALTGGATSPFKLDPPKK